MKIVKYIPILLFSFLSFWSVAPLFRSGFFNVHDNVLVERVFEMSQALSHYQFPVRWVKDLGFGYGYPIFSFYAPLPYYFGGFVHLTGISLVLATKAMFFTGILLAGYSMFFLAKKVWGIWGGFLCAILYLYGPYHALDVYVRGAVGEFWALGFLPLIFLGFYKIYLNELKDGIVVSIIGLCGVVLSHNLTAFMVVPFILLFVVWIFICCENRRKIIYPLVVSILVSSMLTAFYWLPAILEMKYTNVFSQIGGGADFRNHFIYLDQLWDFPWGFGGSAGRNSGISYKIGKPNVLLFLTASLLFLFIKSKKNNLKIFFPVSFVGTVLAVFLTNKSSQGLWETIPAMAFIQYPWRYITIILLFTSLLPGLLLEFWKQKNNIFIQITVVFISIIIVVFHAKYFVPQTHTNYPSSYYQDALHLKWSASKISHEYLPKNFKIPKNIKSIADKRLTVDSDMKWKQIEDSVTLEKFETQSDRYSFVTVNTALFPGWEAYIDNNKIILPQSFLIKLIVPKGKHIITVKFTNTWVRSLANLFSLLGLFGFGVILLRKNYGKNT